MQTNPSEHAVLIGRERVNLPPPVVNFLSNISWRLFDLADSMEVKEDASRFSICKRIIAFPIMIGAAILQAVGVRLDEITQVDPVEEELLEEMGPHFN